MGEFEAFVRASGPSLLRTAYLLTGDRGHAEDVLQAVLERTARKWGSLSGNAEAYARRAVVNAATDRRRRWRARPAETAAAGQYADVPATDDIARVDLRDALVAALRELPPRQRGVLVCRFVLDLDERATAELLGVSAGTVKSSVSRGLAAVRANAPQLVEDR